MNVSMSRINASPHSNRRSFRSTSQTNAASSNHSRSLSSSSYNIENTRRSQLPRCSREESQRKLDKHDVAYPNSRSSAALARPLPEGPGPLPNKFKLSSSRTVRYVPANSTDYSSAKVSTGTTVTYSSKYAHDYANRKVSDDSGYGSSGSSKGTKTSTTSSSDSIRSGRRAKSIANLNSELLDLSVTDRGDRGHLKRSQSYKNSFSTCSGLSNKTRTIADLSRASENTSIFLDKRYTRAGNEGYSTDNCTNRKLVGDTSVSNTSKHSKLDFCSTNNTPKELKNSDQIRHSRSSSQSSESLSTPCSSDGLVGLRNLGNTCFMNSILQCLSNTFQLTEILLKGTHIMSINSKSSMKGKLINAYAELIKSMWKQGSGDSVSPMAFKTQIQRFAPRFVGYSQQDAQEFLRFLLEGLHDDLNKVRQKGRYSSNELSNSLSDSQKAERSWSIYLGRDDSLITDMFVGQLKSTLKCCECGHKSVTFDPFWDLSLPIPRKASGSFSSSSSLSERSGNYPDCCEISLVDCLRYFTREEVLDHDERPTCEKCKTKRKSTKKFSIQRFPKVLVLHLKRFSGYGFRSKLQTNVDFPLTNLDLTEFSANSKAGSSPIYQLRAVSNHSGTTYGGHYTAYCSHPVSGKWYCYNDSRVDALSTSRVKGSNAYILFYEKQDLV